MHSQSNPRRVKVKDHRGIYFRELPGGKRRYEITFLDSDGRRRWRTVDGNLEDADAALDDVKTRKRKGERVAPTKATLAEVADVWYEAQTKLRPRTKAGYKDALDRHVLPRLGRKRIADVSTDDVAGLIAAMEAKGLAGWTIRGVLTPLSRVLGYAARRGLIAGNPVTRLERDERPSIERREMRVLDPVEIGKLLDAAPERYRTLIALSIGTGLRQGEALGLRWQDVELGNRVLHVRWQRGQDGELAPPKTPQARREVVLSPPLVRMLREHKAAAVHSQAGDFVFASHAGTPLGHRNIVRRGLEKAVKAAKLDQDGKPKLRWHDLRHSAASLLISEGLNVVYVSRQLGHADPSITLRTYAHLFASAEHGERARVAQGAAFGNLLETSGGDGRQQPAPEPSAKVLDLAEIRTAGNR